jgi:hypothetical protein
LLTNPDITVTQVAQRLGVSPQGRRMKNFWLIRI